MIKTVTRKLPDAPSPSAIHPYSVNDPIPVPEAIESDSDAAWALWEDSVSAQSSGPGADFKNTTPAKLTSFLLGDSPKHNL
jgi:hypothetical protein